MPTASMRRRSISIDPTYSGLAYVTWAWWSLAFSSWERRIFFFFYASRFWVDRTCRFGAGTIPPVPAVESGEHSAEEHDTRAAPNEPGHRLVIDLDWVKRVSVLKIEHRGFRTDIHLKEDNVKTRTDPHRDRVLANRELRLSIVRQTTLDD